MSLILPPKDPFDLDPNHIAESIWKPWRTICSGCGMFSCTILTLRALPLAQIMQVLLSFMQFPPNSILVKFPSSIFYSVSVLQINSEAQE
jgi:hypothetical protein